MDPKRKQLLASTGQSLEKISHFLGINLSSCMGKLYSLTLMVLFSFLSQVSWRNVCTGYCEKHLMRKFMVTLQHFLYILLVLLMIGTSLFRPKQFAFPRQEMSIIDSILESYGAQFSDKDIFLLKYLQDIVTSIVALLVVMKYTYDVLVDNSFQLIWFSIRSCYPRICLLIMDGLFTHYVTDIYLRFRELNKIAIRHSREKQLISYIDFIAANSKIFNKRNGTVVTKIRSIQHIHHELYILAVKVNTNFGLQLLIASVISLNAIILYLHDTYHNLKTDIGNTNIIIFEIILIFCYALRCLYISYVCQRSRNESRQMAKILHDVFLKHKSLRSEVVHFSLQLVHEDLVFTAFGLYEINIPLICSLAGAVVTYFVMVVQLDITAKFAITNTTWNHDNGNYTSIENSA